LNVYIFAEFENTLRCSSFQHPQPQQPPYMMTGAGELIIGVCVVGPLWQLYRKYIVALVMQ